MKINDVHITRIDAALQEAGIRYVDIRMELTDHIAAELEQEGGDFELLFSTYMICNRKKLKSLNTKFAAIAMQKTFRAFIKNFGTRRFTLVTLLSLIAGETLNCFLPGAPAAGMMFLVFSVTYFMGSFDPMFTWGSPRPQFSVGKFYHVLMLAITFVSMAGKVWDTGALCHIVFLSYALLTAIADTKHTTANKLFDEYKIRYHA